MKHYSKQEVINMNWQKYNQRMADELEEAGFSEHSYGFNKMFPWIKSSCSTLGSNSHCLPFIYNILYSAPELEYLESIGLLNNGRCPKCGANIGEHPSAIETNMPRMPFIQVCDICYFKHIEYREANKKEESIFFRIGNGIVQVFKWILYIFAAPLTIILLPFEIFSFLITMIIEGAEWLKEKTKKRRR